MVGIREDPIDLAVPCISSCVVQMIVWMREKGKKGELFRGCGWLVGDAVNMVECAVKND